MADFTEFPIPTKTFDPAQFAGDDGREVELQTTATHVQWRYVGGAWVDLIALSELTGPAGADGVDGANGDDGREVELRTSGDLLQWRLVGDASWQTLYDLSTLEGGGGTIPDNVPALALQRPTEAFPARPDAEVVYWHTWDEPTLDPLAHPYDVWFQIPEIIALGEPDAFTTDDWTVDATGVSGELQVEVLALPLANPEITAIEYRIGTGAAAALGGATVGTYIITGLTDDVAVDVQLRAVNTEGAGAWSDIKTATPTVAAVADSSVFWLNGDADVYGLDTMNTLSDQTGDTVTVGDPVGFADNVA